MNELTGGIKNAIEKGDNPQKVKQSFVNAGYKPAEVESATREAMAMTRHTQPMPNPPRKRLQGAKLPQTQSPQTNPKKSTTWLTILIIISILLLIIAGLAGLFWDKITGLF